MASLGHVLVQSIALFLCEFALVQLYPPHPLCRPMHTSLDAGKIPSLQELGFSASTLARCAADKAAQAAQLRGGESEALRHLEAFAKHATVSDPSKPSGSGASSSGARARDAAVVSSQRAAFGAKISPWLATGCLSPRQMYVRLRSEMAGAAKPAGGKQADSSWLLFDLLWRDFFRLVSAKYAAAGSQANAAAPTAAPASARAPPYSFAAA